MLLTLVTVVLAFFALVLTQQIVGVIVFVVACSRRTAVSDDDLPEALVVLALRGAEPTLQACVRGSLQQDYPRYRVRIIVDSHQDSAWDAVHAVLAEVDQVDVDVFALTSPAATCTLKCSAIHQATDSLPDSCEVVVTLDSDIVPHRTWLRELVAPMRNPKVGATMGNRWYAPSQGNWGSWIRYLWNCAAVVLMYYGKVPWGGSLATRASILRETDLRDQWRKAGCEDLPLAAILRRRRLKLEFVPSVMMVSREDCDVSGCLRFIRRQLVWTRLYQPPIWWSGFISYLAITTVLSVALVATVFAAASRQWYVAALLLMSVLGYFVMQSAQVAALEWWLRRSIAPHGRRGATIQLRTLLAIPLTQCCSLAMMWQSFTCRLVEWRGIEYEIDGPWDIRMVQYKPYVPSDADSCPDPATTDSIQTQAEAP